MTLLLLASAVGLATVVALALRRGLRRARSSPASRCPLDPESESTHSASSSRTPADASRTHTPRRDLGQEASGEGLAAADVTAPTPNAPSGTEGDGSHRAEVETGIGELQS